MALFSFRRNRDKLRLRMAESAKGKTRKTLAASHQEPSGKNASGEYATFENALKAVLSVSHSRIKHKIDAEKRRRTKVSASRAEV
jgi:hypothetical protein